MMNKKLTIIITLITILILSSLLVYAKIKDFHHEDDDVIIDAQYECTGGKIKTCTVYNYTIQVKENKSINIFQIKEQFETSRRIIELV